MCDERASEVETRGAHTHEPVEPTNKLVSSEEGRPDCDKTRQVIGIDTYHTVRLITRLSTPPSVESRISRRADPLWVMCERNAHAHPCPAGPHDCHDLTRGRGTNEGGGGDE